jgi:hypothetical protein
MQAVIVLKGHDVGGVGNLAAQFSEHGNGDLEHPVGER